jgi:Glycosyl transferase family 2
VDVERKGYGAALLGGIESARGRYVVMGDADDSYDFANLEPFLAKLREGYELVMGNRFEGGIKPGAMPWKNRYIGNPTLSAVGRLFYSSDIRDFHCGIRGFAREPFRRLGLRTTGMEFASEMIVEATLHGLRITEVPTTLSPDGRSRPPHLRPWRDGWRHLRFLLTYSPDWLFLYPGAVLLALGLLTMGAITALGSVAIGGVVLEVHTLVVAALATVVGVQSLAFGLVAKQFGVREGMLPTYKALDRVLRVFSVERATFAGAACFVLGLAGLAAATWIWSSRDFGDLDYRETMRLVVPAAALVAVGMQIVLAGFVSGMFRIAQRP